MTTRPRYFTPTELTLHNSSDDIWVSYLGKVYDLTPLCKKFKGDSLLKPILQEAGKDISHWFNAKTGDVRTYVDPLTNCLLLYAPHGRFIHIPPPYPSSDWANDFGVPWWKDDHYYIGLMSKKTRNIKIINTLTSQEHVIEVCCEEWISEILRRYEIYNKHAASYTWKYDCRNLEMDKTLEENGIRDDDEDFYRLKMNEDEFLQCIHVYFNDDLTEA